MRTIVVRELEYPPTGHPDRSEATGTVAEPGPVVGCVGIARAEEGGREPAPAGDADAGRPRAGPAGVPGEAAPAGESDSDGSKEELEPTDAGLLRMLADEAEQRERQAVSEFAARVGFPFAVPTDRPPAVAARQIADWYESTTGKPTSTRMQVIAWLEKHAAEAHESWTADPAQRDFVLGSLWSSFVRRLPQFADRNSRAVTDAFWDFIDGAGNKGHLGKGTSRPKKWVAAGRLLNALDLGGAITAHTDGENLGRQVRRARREMQQAGLL